MKHLVKKRSLTFFLAGSATLIAATSFLSGYTDGEIGLLSPFLIVLAAGMAAILFEIAMQLRTK
jgi:hypothetical protein